MTKLTRRIIGLAAAVLFSVQANAGTPLRMIIETDMGNDIDDALAVALAMKAMDQGLIDVLAIGCHKNCPTAAPFTDLVTTYYNHPEVQVAMSLTPVQEYSNYVDYTVRPTRMGFKTSQSEYPDPVQLYRKILSESPDHSVAFASFGFGTTLAQLILSKPDEYSKLNGLDLVKKKVKALCIMAGSYGDKKRAEYNVKNDIPAMAIVFEYWPGVIYQNPFEIGEHVLFPAKLVEENLGYEGENPVAEAYKDYKKMPYNRPTWDLLSVVWFLRPDLFTVSEPGVVTVDKEGYTNFTPKRSGRHYVLSATIDQPRALKDYICEMAVK